MSAPRFDPSRVPGMRKRYLQLNPVNASSGGNYSFASGLPLVKFDLSSSENAMFMDGRELRITGKLKYEVNAGVAPALNANQYVDGSTGLFAGCLDTVTISSKFLNTTLERINNYSRMVPSVISGTHSQQDTSVDLSHGGLHQQSVPMTKFNISSNNYYNTERFLAAAEQEGKAFSSPLYCGIFHIS